MKMIAAMISLISLSAFANSDRPVWPTINFHGTNVAVNNVCSTDTGFRTVQPVRTCTETVITARYACHQNLDAGDGVYTPAETCRKISADSEVRAGEFLRVERQCQRSDETVLTTGKIGQRTVCVAYSEVTESENPVCLKWEKQAYTIPTRYTVTIVHFDGDFAGMFNYKIPACH